MGEMSARAGDYWVGLSDTEAEGAFVWEHTKVAANFTAWGKN